MIKAIVRFSLLFACLASVSCTQKIKRQANNKTMAVNYILQSASKKIAAEKKVSITSIGCAAMHKVESLELGISANRYLDIPTARKLLIDSAQILIDEVQQNQQVQPYLLNTGFNLENASIILYIRPDYKTPLEPNLGVTTCKNGILKYKVYDKEFYEEKQLPKAHTIYQETYQEALAALNQSPPQQQLETPTMP